MSNNSRVRCTGLTGGPAKVIAGARGCLDLSRTRVLPVLAAATFRIGLIMERGLVRQRISPGSDYARREREVPDQLSTRRLREPAQLRQLVL